MRKLVGLLAAILALVVPARAEAQATLGGAVAWHDDFDLGIAVFGLAPVPSIHENVSIGGDFAYFFPDEPGNLPGGEDVSVSYFEINANMFYSFREEDLSFTPFVLGGLNIARASLEVDGTGELFEQLEHSDTDIGLNAGGGIAFGTGESGIQPVVGVKIELGGGEGFVLFGGVGFPVGG